MFGFSVLLEKGVNKVFLVSGEMRKQSVFSEEMRKQSVFSE